MMTAPVTVTVELPMADLEAMVQQAVAASLSGDRWQESPVKALVRRRVQEAVAEALDGTEATAMISRSIRANLSGVIDAIVVEELRKVAKRKVKQGALELVPPDGREDG